MTDAEVRDAERTVVSLARDLSDLHLGLLRSIANGEPQSKQLDFLIRIGLEFGLDCEPECEFMALVTKCHEVMDATPEPEEPRFGNMGHRIFSESPRRADGQSVSVIDSPKDASVWVLIDWPDNARLESVKLDRAEAATVSKGLAAFVASEPAEPSTTTVVTP